MNYQQQPPPPPPPQGYQQPQQYGPPQGYPPQQAPYQQQPAPGYGAPQGYGQPQQPQPQGPPPTLEEYYSQPKGGGGPGVKFSNKPVGWGFEFRIARDVTGADIQQVTNPQTKQLEFYSDGRRKLQLVVPLLVGITPEWSDGRATLYAKSGIREALDVGMAAAGCPSGQFPKEGDTGKITFVGTQPTGLSDKKLFEVDYTPGPKWSNLASSNGQAQPPAPDPVESGVPSPPVHGLTPPPQQPAAQTPPPPPPPPGAAPQQAPPPPPPAPQQGGEQPQPQRPEGMTDAQYAQFTGATTGQAPPPPPPGQAPPQ